MRTIPLKLDRFDPPRRGVGRDTTTGKCPTTWKGNATTIRIGCYDNDVLIDLTGYTAFELAIKPDQLTNTNKAHDTVAAPTSGTITQSGWDNGTEEHLSFVFPDNEMNIDLEGKTERKYWLVVTALDTAGNETTLGTAWFIISDDNNGTADPPPENPGAGITQDAADGRYVQKSATPVTEAGTTRTLVAADAFTFIEFTNVAGCVVTVDEDVFIAGNEIYFKQMTAGAVTFAGTVDLSELYEDYLPQPTGQYATIAMRFSDADTADLVGQLKLA